MPYNHKEIEEESLTLWEEKHIFERSVSERPEDNPYVFYDGPPFATGLPHYGHIVASFIKDAVPRFWTMRGFRVERKWGWDCHGLPIEHIIEKNLHLSSRQAIELCGVDTFNEACRDTVLTYVDEWKRVVRRIGRWVDMEHDYKTMDLSFMESVWWVFKELWAHGLIYEGYKPMHICPRCVTPLSNFEVTQNYKEVKDIAVTVKFKLIGARERLCAEGEVHMLAWTTTPWTLPGNVALAVGNDIAYALVKSDDGMYVLAKDRAQYVFENKEYIVIKALKASELIGLAYEPLFPYYADSKGAFRVVAGDFVTTESGTGIVHIAPAFGDDDYALSKKEHLPFVQHVRMDGTFKKEVTDFAGMHVKPADDTAATDVAIIKWLAGRGALFSKEKIEHSYPLCWRCDTPLLNYATSSWFVRVTELKDELLAANAETSWVPAHIRDGRFGKWLEGARDWAISRNRFWGTPLPIWKSEDGEVLCMGSVSELEEATGARVTDLHKHLIDPLVIEKGGKKFHRIPEVLDCWFESGSMPYGQMHYPFENKEKFERGFPAEFIAEGQDQTRGWFYTLHVLAVALTRGSPPSIPAQSPQPLPAFKHVIVNGIVLAEDGKKMSKRLQNYPEPDAVIDAYGADALRYYVAASPVMEAEQLNFSETGVREMYNKLLNTLWNVYAWYEMHTDDASRHAVAELAPEDAAHALDRWIAARLQMLISEVRRNMEAYRLMHAARPIAEFAADLSQWYVRRSRDRFKRKGADKDAATRILGHVLLTLSKVMAPFTPFIAEALYQRVGAGDSVHLETWPEAKWDMVDEGALAQMEEARTIVELGLAARAQAKIKVRQPLLCAQYEGRPLGSELERIIADELNVESVSWVERVKEDDAHAVKSDKGVKVRISITLTRELKERGIVRDLVRAINQMRKDAALTVHDRIRVRFATESADMRALIEKNAHELAEGVLADEILCDINTQGKAVHIEGISIPFEITKV